MRFHNTSGTLIAQSVSQSVSQPIRLSFALISCLISVASCSDERPIMGAVDSSNRGSLSPEDISSSPQLTEGMRRVFLRNIAMSPETVSSERTPAKVYGSPAADYDYSKDSKKIAKFEKYRGLLHPVRTDEFSIIVGDGETGEEYQIIQTLEGLRVADEFARSIGYKGDSSNGSSAEASEVGHKQPGLAPGLTPQTVVGTDDRDPYNIGPYTADEWPLRTIVRVTTDPPAPYAAFTSSGTLIGNRLVLSQAHDVFEADGTIKAWPEIVPRQDTANPAPPYGVVTPLTYHYPTAWVSMGCMVTSSAECNAYDWIVWVLRTTPFGATHPGWMGYAADTDSVTSGWYLYRKGFPACGNSGPPGCVWGWMFGHNSGGGTQFDLPMPNWPYYGANSRLHHYSDTSPSDSGSALYTYLGSAGPCVVSLHNQNKVIAGTAGYGLRLTPYTVYYFNSLRAQYP